MVTGEVAGARGAPARLSAAVKQSAGLAALVSYTPLATAWSAGTGTRLASCRGVFTAPHKYKRPIEVAFSFFFLERTLIEVCVRA